jgi:ribosomal protein S12 methylthiotransferase accessory factor
VSAYVSHPAAVRHAVLEVLERDLIWRGWYEAHSDALLLCRLSLPYVLSQTLHELRLQPTILILPGPVHTACVVVCLHRTDRRQQSFGARCVLVADDVSLRKGIETATYEALMVRWSMATSVARRAWQNLRHASPVVAPQGALEHALWAFHRQDSLGHWLAKVAPERQASATSLPNATADEHQLACLLAEHTGEDVVAVDTTTRDVCAEGITVVRVVAPGARRLPTDERDVPLPCQPDGRRPLPHPFG